MAHGSRRERDSTENDLIVFKVLINFGQLCLFLHGGVGRHSIKSEGRDNAGAYSGKGGGGCQGMAMSSRSEQLLLDTHPPENYPPLGQLPHP